MTIIKSGNAALLAAAALALLGPSAPDAGVAKLVDATDLND